MTDPIRIRPASPDDAAPLAALLNEIIAIGGTTALDTAFTPGRLTEWFIDGPRPLFCTMAEDATGALGFQAVGTHPDLPGDWGDIATFARVRDRRPGVGRALFAETRARAEALGLAALNATIRADNTGGLSYYDRMGFEDYAVRRAVPLGDGTPVDRISKRLMLGGR